MIGAVVCSTWSTLGQQIGENNPCFPYVSMYRPIRQKSDNFLKLQYPFKSPYILMVPQKSMMTIWP